MTSFLNNLSVNKRKKTPEQLVVSAKNSMLALINHHKLYEAAVVSGLGHSYESPRDSTSPMLQNSHPASPNSHDGGPLMIESRSRSLSDTNTFVKSRSNSTADIAPLTSQTSSGSLTLDTNTAHVATHTIPSSISLAQVPTSNAVLPDNKGHAPEEIMDKIQQQQLNLAKLLVEMKLILHPVSTPAVSSADSNSASAQVNAEVVLSQQLQTHHLLALCIQHLWFISFEGRKDIVLIFNALLHRDIAGFASVYFSRASLDEKVMHMTSLESSLSMLNLSRNTSNNSINNAADSTNTTATTVVTAVTPTPPSESQLNDEHLPPAVPESASQEANHHSAGIAIDAVERELKEVPPPIPLASSVTNSPSVVSSGKHNPAQTFNKNSVLAFIIQHLVRGYNKPTPSTLTWMNFLREDNATAVNHTGLNNTTMAASTPTSAASMGLVSPLLNTCNNNVALSCGLMLRECIKHTVAVKYLLEDDLQAANAAARLTVSATPEEGSPVIGSVTSNSAALIWLFFDIYVHLPTFDIASDAFTTLKELLTGDKHKELVHTFLEQESATFLLKFEVLLKTDNYVTRRRSLQLLASLLIDRTHYSFMMRYISDKEHLKTIMNLLRHKSPQIQLETFHVFKIFVANPKKSMDVGMILFNNRTKLIAYLEHFHEDKDHSDPQFAEEKRLLIETLETMTDPVQHHHSHHSHSHSAAQLSNANHANANPVASRSRVNSVEDAEHHP